MYPLKKGKTARQAHVGLPNGTFEEEHGRKGFYGKSAHLYHTHPPTGWIRFEGKLRPHCFDLNQLAPTDQRDPAGHAGRVPRQRGCDALRFAPLRADAVLLPQCRWRRADLRPSRRGHHRDRFRAARIREGRLHQHPARRDVSRDSPDARQFLPDRPVEDGIRSAGKGTARPARALRSGCDHDARARAASSTTTASGKCASRWTTRFPKWSIRSIPWTWSGWKGDLTVWKINMRDIRPIMSHRAHLPPSAHTTFVTEGAVVCSFLPRPLEQDEDALRVPFFHRNTDYDEFIFYHDGDFFSKDNIKPGYGDAASARHSSRAAPQGARQSEEEDADRRVRRDAGRSESDSRAAGRARRSSGRSTG